MKNFTKNPPLGSELIKFNIPNLNIEIVLKTMLFFLAFITFESRAQTTNSSGEIKEVNSFLSSLKSTSITDYEKANHLINDSNTAIYINNNILKTYGENYIALFSDIVSLNYIKNNSIPSNSVEIVRINIKKSTDVNGKIDLSLFSNFPNLKYIYIVSGININKQNIANMIINNTEEYTLLYQIDQAE